MRSESNELTANLHTTCPLLHTIIVSFLFASAPRKRYCSFSRSPRFSPKQAGIEPKGPHSLLANRRIEAKTLTPRFPPALPLRLVDRPPLLIQPLLGSLRAGRPGLHLLRHDPQRRGRRRPLHGAGRGPVRRLRQPDPRCHLRVHVGGEAEPRLGDPARHQDVPRQGARAPRPGRSTLCLRGDGWRAALTARDRQVSAIARLIKEKHPYECPELITLDVVDGLPDYLQWVAKSVTAAGPPADGP